MSIVGTENILFTDIQGNFLEVYEESFYTYEPTLGWNFGYNSGNFDLPETGNLYLAINQIPINFRRNSLHSAYLNIELARHDGSYTNVSGVISALNANYYGYNSVDTVSISDAFDNYAISKSLNLPLGGSSINITDILSGVINSNTWEAGNSLSLKIANLQDGDPLHKINNFQDCYITINYQATIPDAPTNVNGTPEYKAISLTWDAPTEDGSSDILYYQVQYQLADSNNAPTWIDAGIAYDRTFTVTNLVNGTEYIFRVSAVNGIGSGPYSSISPVLAPDHNLLVRAANDFNDANYTRIRLRRDTSSDWSGVNPILGLGEPGFETDTKLLKIGDNNTSWNDLDYVKVDNNSITFPDPPDVTLTIGDSNVNEDSPRINCNLSNNEKLNIVAERGVNLDYSSQYNALTFSLDHVFSPFASGTLYSPASRGRPGSVFTDEEYMYICTRPNFWKRIPLEQKFWFDPSQIAISDNTGFYPSVTDIYFSGFNIFTISDGDPYPAKAGSNLVNDGAVYRNAFFNNYQINDQSYNFAFRYRGGESSQNPQSAMSGFNGIMANGVLFSNPSAGPEGIGSFAPPSGFNYDRGFFSSFYKVDDCGGYVNFDRRYFYVNNKFLKRCWDNEKVTHNNSYYSGTNHSGDYFRHADGHSKILGFCFDGYPIYGPFGYTDPDNSGTTTLMTSSYVAKTGDSHRPDGWKYTNAIAVNDINYNLTAGAFIQDYEYLEGSGLLDQYNGRYSVTPEYPDGTYAYYLTFTDDTMLIPKYPYIIGNHSKQRKLIQDIIPSINPLTVDGYFPLFTATNAARDYGLLNGGDGTYTTYVIFTDTYYMPNGIDNIRIPYAPTDISLSENKVSEKATIGSIIGTFSTTDLNTEDIHTYTFVSGDGDEDNDNFTIYNNELRVNSILSEGIQSAHNIRVRSTDPTNRFFEKSFIVNVLEGTEFTSLSITSGISTLIAGSGHTFGSSVTASANDITYSWSIFGSPYVSGTSFNNTNFSINSTNISERNDETINVYLTAKSISAFTTLLQNTSFTLDHSEEAVCIEGYYPLYSSKNDADRDPNGDGTSHMHTVQGVIYWMPNGLDDYYHGNFDCNSLT